MRSIVVALLAAVGFTGCVVDVGLPACEDVASTVTTVPLGSKMAEHHPSIDHWQTVAFANASQGETLVQRLHRASFGVPTLDEHVLPAHGSPGLVVVGGSMGMRDVHAIAVHARPIGEACAPPLLATVDLAAHEGPLQTAEAGKGTHVLTAGFWPNGTLFYTNIAHLHQSAWPRAGWYAWEGSDPLPVYGSDRAEQPAWWKDPQAGTPAEGTVPGLGYFTTIPGFNEALQGLSTGGTTVAVVPPDMAYTRAGYEDHPLYGDTLVFVIRALDVVDLPCPMQVPHVVCSPTDPMAGSPLAASR
jgi:hypothetical protein